MFVFVQRVSFCVEHACLPILLLIMYVHKARVENNLGDMIVSGIGERTS